MGAFGQELLESAREAVQIAAGEAQPARTFRSAPLAAVHELMSGFCRSGAIDKQTMTLFNDACLAPGNTTADPQLK